MENSKRIKCLVALLPALYALLGYLVLLEGALALSLALFAFSVIFGICAIGLATNNK